MVLLLRPHWCAGLAPSAAGCKDWLQLLQVVWCAGLIPGAGAALGGCQCLPRVPDGMGKAEDHVGEALVLAEGTYLGWWGRVSFQIFSVCSWLNPQMWNPQIQRADYT